MDTTLAQAQQTRLLRRSQHTLHAEQAAATQTEDPEAAARREKAELDFDFRSKMNNSEIGRLVLAATDCVKAYFGLVKMFTPLGPAMILMSAAREGHRAAVAEAARESLDALAGHVDSGPYEEAQALAAKALVDLGEAGRNPSKAALDTFRADWHFARTLGLDGNPTFAVRSLDTAAAVFSQGRRPVQAELAQVHADEARLFFGTNEVNAGMESLRLGQPANAEIEFRLANDYYADAVGHTDGKGRGRDQESQALAGRAVVAAAIGSDEDVANSVAHALHSAGDDGLKGAVLHRIEEGASAFRAVGVNGAAAASRLDAVAAAVRRDQPEVGKAANRIGSLQQSAQRLRDSGRRQPGGPPSPGPAGVGVPAQSRAPQTKTRERVDLVF